MREDPPLLQRFRENLRALGVTGADARIVVALSGGADSVALLHLLRFGAADLGVRVAAAHFDHAMRPESARDAEWVAGLCRAWGVPLATARADRPLHGEEQARGARHAFLHAARTELAGDWLATAHHADDQAETVLFRVLRGTGAAGLAGMAEKDDGRRIIRPLLPFWRAELRRHARAARLRWREDPTNAAGDAARSVIRRDVLPLVERAVAPGARRSLVRLAALAREDEAAWEALLGREMQGLAREEEGELVLVRDRLAGYDSAVAARLLRGLLRRMGAVPDRTGTRTALRFICTAPSGRELELAGGLRIRTEFGQARITRGHPEASAEPDLPLEIGGEAGSGRCRTGGRERRVEWRAGPASAEGGAVEMGDADGALCITLPADLNLPLLLRGWLPGDRVRTPGGTKTLKKLFNQARIPRSRRGTVPVLADARGAVLWVAGVARGAPPPQPGERGLTVTLTDA